MCRQTYRNLIAKPQLDLLVATVKPYMANVKPY